MNASMFHGTLHVLVACPPVHIPKRLHKQTPLVQLQASMQLGLSNQNDQNRDDIEQQRMRNCMALQPWLNKPFFMQTEKTSNSKQATSSRACA